MPKTRQQKEETVTNLTQKFSEAASVVFTDYKGMTMSQLADLRAKLREVSGEFSVTKNNLVKISLKKAGIEVDEKLLDGPTATLFSFGDEIAPIAILTKALKDNGIGEVKLGVLNGEVMDKYKVQKLASLPSKDELRGKVVGVLVAPLHGMVGVLQGNLRNLVYALEQIRVQKGGE